MRIVIRWRILLHTTSYREFYNALRTSHRNFLLPRLPIWYIATPDQAPETRQLCMYNTSLALRTRTQPSAASKHITSLIHFTFCACAVNFPCTAKRIFSDGEEETRFLCTCVPSSRVSLVLVVRVTVRGARIKLERRDTTVHSSECVVYCVHRHGVYMVVFRRVSD